MKRPLGKWRRISSSRQMIADLMYFSKSLPLVAMERTMHLGNVAKARAKHPERPPWSAIFAKSFGLVTQEIAALRQVYLKVPIPHIFEYEESYVSIAYEMEDEEEAFILPVRIRSPDKIPITGFRFKIDEMRSDYLSRRGFYRIVEITGFFPAILRRPIWWTVLNVPHLRKRFFGTFAITSVGFLGANMITPIAPFTSLLTYGPISEDGQVIVRLVFDHRLYDGVTAARALARLEEHLVGCIFEELDAVPLQRSSRI
jgi:hypothetical protein